MGQCNSSKSTRQELNTPTSLSSQAPLLRSHTVVLVLVVLVSTYFHFLNEHRMLSTTTIQNTRVLFVLIFIVALLLLLLSLLCYNRLTIGISSYYLDDEIQYFARKKWMGGLVLFVFCFLFYGIHPKRKTKWGSKWHKYCQVWFNLSCFFRVWFHEQRQALYCWHGSVEMPTLGSLCLTRRTAITATSLLPSRHATKATTTMTSSRSFVTTTTTATTTQSHSISGRLLPNVHPLHLFRIVQDVDKYQDFLPFCGHSEVFPETIRDGGRFFEAELAVGFGPSSLFQTRYLSRVVVDPINLIIETKSGKSVPTTTTTDYEKNNNNDNGMFESLTSRWKLHPMNTSLSSNNIGTSVDFSVEMTVSDPMVATVLNRVLVDVAETQVRAFSDRCKVIPPPTRDELLAAERYYKVNQHKNDTSTSTTNTSNKHKWNDSGCNFRAKSMLAASLNEWIDSSTASNYLRKIVCLHRWHHLIPTTNLHANQTKKYRLAFHNRRKFLP